MTGRTGPRPRGQVPAQGAGILIREARLRAGLTQKEFAARAHTAQSAVSRLECGTISPTVETLERMLRAAGAELVLTIRQKES